MDTKQVIWSKGPTSGGTIFDNYNSSFLLASYLIHVYNISLDLPI